MIWKTKEGKKIDIKNMETSHIRNTIAMLKRTMPDHEEDEMYTADHWSLPGVYTAPGAKKYKAKIKEFEKELKQRS